MKTCGIVAEYNPFHNGHKYHIDKTRKILGQNTAIISIMSGNFVQRGDFSIMEKYQRAKSAIFGGSDLVLELPLTSSLSSAEGFANGAVSVLNDLGLVNYLSFGCETNNMSTLSQICDILLSNEFPEQLKKELALGVSFPVARQNAINCFSPKHSEIIKAPNNILAIEYIKAIKLLNSEIIPLGITRNGVYHDSSVYKSCFASASLLREKIKNDKLSKCSNFMPQTSYDILESEIANQNAPVTIENAEKPILAYLRRLSTFDFGKLSDTGEGLANKLSSAFYEATSLQEGLMSAKSKRYTLSRLRRIVLSAYLEITSELSSINPQYIRVLAFNNTGRQVLKELKSSCTLPIITKPLDGKNLTDDAKRLFDLDLLADDLYYLNQPSPKSGGSHFKNTPYYLNNA